MQVKYTIGGNKLKVVDIKHISFAVRVILITPILLNI